MQVARRSQEALATKIAVALEDDLDGGPADETLRFAIGGTEYEIDLRKKNARKTRTPAARDRSADIRAWAKANGIPVSDRGRIPASVAAQYQTATR